MRLRAHVSVAYGSDVDQVREVLVDCARDLEFVSGSLAPVVRFEALGDSGLDFTVRVMIDHPRHRAAVRDELNTRIYKALNEARIEIPFPQQDLHIRDWPGAPGGN
jgi:small-conductance mechanosensitive channel